MKQLPQLSRVYDGRIAGAHHTNAKHSLYAGKQNIRHINLMKQIFKLMPIPAKQSNSPTTAPRNGNCWLDYGRRLFYRHRMNHSYEHTHNMRGFRERRILLLLSIGILHLL